MKTQQEYLQDAKDYRDIELVRERPEIYPTVTRGELEFTICSGDWQSGAGLNDILVIHNTFNHSTVVVHDKDQVDSIEKQLQLK